MHMTAEGFVERRKPALPPPDFVDPRSLRERVCMVVWEDPTDPTKIGLCITALFLAYYFWTNRGTCHYVACANLFDAAAPFGGWLAWAIGYTGYGLVKLWRIIDRTHRPYIAWGVNIFGCFLFSATAFALGSAAPHWYDITLGVPFAVSVALAACWVLMRTMIPPRGVGIRGD